MINVDTRLLNGELDHNEFWLLMHIAKRINAKKTCFPNNDTLANDTKFSIDKVIKLKKSLAEKGIISCEQRRYKGSFSSNIYRINTKFISIFVNLSEGTYEEEPTDTAKHRNGETPNPQNTVTIKNGNKVLAKENEVLAKENEVLNNVQNEFERLSQNSFVGLANEKIEETINSNTNEKKKSPPAGFDKFWEQYPKKVAKKQAEKVFKTIIKTQPIETIMQALECYKTHLKAKNIASDYILMPSTFLNGRYEDFLPQKDTVQTSNGMIDLGKLITVEARGVTKTLTLREFYALCLQNPHLLTVYKSEYTPKENELEDIRKIIS